MFNLMIDKDSKTFWEGAKKNKLMLQKSKNNGNYFLYSLGHSDVAADHDFEWVEVSGNGKIYSFTITVLMSLEALGFCKIGEGKDFVKNGNLGPNGSFPINTNGGGLSYCHPGMYSIFTLIEACRQLWGHCGERQLKKKSYQRSLPWNRRSFIKRCNYYSFKGEFIVFNLMTDKDSKTFWEGAKKNKLMLQKSKNNGNYFLYSVGHSNVAADHEFEWVEASGNGKIYSFTVSYIPGGSKYYLDKTPYVIGSILLEENVRIMSNIITNDIKSLEIGKKVKVYFRKLTDEIVFPCFKLV